MDKNLSNSPHSPPIAKGSLYVIATPIGNLKDISQRAIETLLTVDAVLAEDTRHSGLLLKALGIQKPLLSLHAHNEHEKTNSLIQALLQGQIYALISDAGTPLIRDPGYTLVHQARVEQIPVIPIPGACAFITALSAAGIPCDSFTFTGFLAVKRSARLTQLHALRAQEHTLVFYESTHRLSACLADIAHVYGPNYRFVLAKELTKMHETFITGSALEIQTWLNADKNRKKGEFVLLLPPDKSLKNNPRNESELLQILLSELPLKQAVKIAAKLTKTPKNTLYEQALRLTP